MANTSSSKEDGEADWERTTEGLTACEQFDPLLRAFPELKDILVDPSRIEHEALRRTLDLLSDDNRAFREAVSPVVNSSTSVACSGADGKQSKMSASDFGEWLERQSHGLESRLRRLDTASELVEADP